MITFIINSIWIFVVACIVYLFRERFSLIPRIWKMFSWKIFFQTLSMVIGSRLLGFALRLSVPYANIDWTEHWFGHSLNPTFNIPSQLYLSSNPVTRHALPVLFCLSMILIMPLLAGVEEAIFRKGKLSTKQIIGWSLAFGLLHSTNGLPLGSAIGLIFAGLFFGYQYRQAYYKAHADAVADPDHEILALEEHCHNVAWMTSTAYHTMWNTILLTLAAIAFCF